MSAVNMRMALKVGARENLNCSASHAHGRNFLLDRQEPYLLWSSIREPAARALSEFYHFQVSRRGVDPTETDIKDYLISVRNRQFNNLADHQDPIMLLKQNFNKSNDRDAYWHELIQQYILQPYHFVGLLERKYESFAVLKLLWGLETEDLVVLDAKRSGGYDGGKFKSTCFRIQSPPKPHPLWLQQFITKEFATDNVDYLLYHILNRTLDVTIQSLGKDVVDQEANKLKSLQALAEETCQERAIFPCSSNGTRQHEAAAMDCYLTDRGCGYRCVDEVLGG